MEAKEIIDILAFASKTGLNINYNTNRKEIADKYLSIISVNPNELEAIRQHEGKEKVCIHNYKPNVDLELQCTLCFKLKNEDYAN